MNCQGPCLEHCFNSIETLKLINIVLLSFGIGYFACKIRVKHIVRKNKIRRL